jgi:hypothetical protein
VRPGFQLAQESVEMLAFAGAKRRIERTLEGQRSRR